MARRPRQQLSALDRKGLALILACIVVVVSAGAALYSTRPPSRDEETLCIAQIPTEHTLLLLDKTDPWSRYETDRLRDLILGLRNDIVQDQKLSIFVFNGVPEQDVEPAFSLCSPGRGEEANWLWGNPRRIQNRFDEAFGARLEALLENLTTPSQGEASPILEMLAELTSRKEFSRAVPRRELIVVSDMMQNSEGLSFYRQLPASEALAGLAGERRFEEVDGLRTTIREVRRDHPDSMARILQDRWEAFFSAAGASLRWSLL